MLLSLHKIETDKLQTSQVLPATCYINLLHNGALKHTMQTGREPYRVAIYGRWQPLDIGQDFTPTVVRKPRYRTAQECTATLSPCAGMHFRTSHSCTSCKRQPSSNLVFNRDGNNIVKIKLVFSPTALFTARIEPSHSHIVEFILSLFSDFLASLDSGNRVCGFQSRAPMAFPKVSKAGCTDKHDDRRQ